MTRKKKQPSVNSNDVKSNKSNKSRKTKEVVVDKTISDLSKALEIVMKSYTEGGSTHKVYKNIPSELIIDNTVEKGRRLLSAIYPDTHDIYLMSYHKPGEQCYPYGGVKIFNKTLNETKQVYPDAVVKHKKVEYYNRTDDMID
jgi:hypothetical protein